MLHKLRPFIPMLLSILVIIAIVAGSLLTLARILPAHAASTPIWSSPLTDISNGQIAAFPDGKLLVQKCLTASDTALATYNTDGSILSKIPMGTTPPYPSPCRAKVGRNGTIFVTLYVPNKPSELAAYSSDGFPMWTSSLPNPVYGEDVQETAVAANGNLLVLTNTAHVIEFSGTTGAVVYDQALNLAAGSGGPDHIDAYNNGTILTTGLGPTIAYFLDTTGKQVATVTVTNSTTYPGLASINGVFYIPTGYATRL